MVVNVKITSDPLVEDPGTHAAAEASDGSMPPGSHTTSQLWPPTPYAIRREFEPRSHGSGLIC